MSHLSGCRVYLSGCRGFISLAAGFISLAVCAQVCAQVVSLLWLHVPPAPLMTPPGPHSSPPAHHYFNVDHHEEDEVDQQRQVHLQADSQVADGPDREGQVAALLVEGEARVLELVKRDLLVVILMTQVVDD